MVKTGDELTIGDELRDWCDRNDENGCGGFVTEYSFEDIFDLAERVDKEMIELPRDKNGVPIHVGDTVYLDDGGKAKVVRIQLSEREDSIGFTVCGGFFALWPEDLTHTAPDSWERIADELEKLSESNRINGNGEVFYRAGDLAKRIRMSDNTCEHWKREEDDER